MNATNESNAADTIRAAGCLVYRFGAKGNEVSEDPEIEVLVVHRPRYDDWDFPKGKREDGESDEACARRETEEETGFVGEMGMELETDFYHVGEEPKAVRWWLLKVTEGTFIANEEVDEVRWLSPGDAAAILSYDHAKRLLADLDLSAL